MLLVLANNALFVSAPVFLVLVAAGLIYRRQRGKKKRYRAAQQATPSLSEANTILASKAETDVLMQPAKKPRTTHKNKAYQVITIYLLADPNDAYGGYHLLQTLLSANLHFGAMSIFHYYLDTPSYTKREKPCLFSVASVVSPGTFDVDNMGQFSSPGLVLFMELDKPLGRLKPAFDALLNTAYTLMDDLGGRLYDESRAPLTHEKLQQWHDTIARLETGQLTGDLFAE